MRRKRSMHAFGPTLSARACALTQKCHPHTVDCSRASMSPASACDEMSARKCMNGAVVCWDWVRETYGSPWNHVLLPGMAA